MKKILIICLLVLTFQTTSTILAKENESVDHNRHFSVENSKQDFSSADEFYEKEKRSELFNVFNTEKYREYDKAELNIREKVLFKDLKETLTKKLNKKVPSTIYSQPSIKVDPNRQVYFYGSVDNTQSGQQKFKFAIFDAESKQLLWAGKDISSPR
ncbi:MAG: hypothetical protein ACQEWF_23375 [Bacillota bacterium]